MHGWIKLHRRILKSALYKQLNSKQRDVMMTLLLLANHDPHTWEFNGQVYQIQPGQFITSLDSLQENCASDVSIQNIRTALLKLEKHGFLTNESTKKNRLITVVNWDMYQGYEDDANKEDNKELTNNQQTANKQLTTNKNVKNVKNVENVKNNKNKKINYAEYVSMAEKDYQKLVDQYGESVVNQMISVLDNYKGAKGKTYKCDYRAILSWVVKRVCMPEEELQREQPSIRPFRTGRGSTAKAQSVSGGIGEDTRTDDDIFVRR